jgi:alkylation response protein AidB-like acyl-CoA dehydrogenase
MSDVTRDDDVREETADEAAFRERVREWLAENAPGSGAAGTNPEMDFGGDTLAAAKDFQARLFDAGLAGLTWPKEYGGAGLDNRHRRIFDEEAARYALPTGVFLIGLGMCGPTILEHGTHEQKQRYIPRMLRGDEVWCQLFSEPGAGSDVAGLQSRAQPVEDGWLLNGQKVWTSGAHYCDYGIVIARTDPDQPKHRGITMFIVDMTAPGVTIRPLRQITGESNFNEVFFEDVHIPAEHLVGDVNDGWRASITTLMNERVSIGSSGGDRDPIEPFVRAVRERGLDGDEVTRDEIASLFVRQRVQRYLGMRLKESLRAGVSPGPLGSVAKLHGSTIAERSSRFGVELAGLDGVAWSPDESGGDRWARGVLSAPGSVIAGGTSDIQRNIIGERVLGLPKEPQVDRDVPFREITVGTQR